MPYYRTAMAPGIISKILLQYFAENFQEYILQKGFNKDDLLIKIFKLLNCEPILTVRNVTF